MMDRGNATMVEELPFGSKTEELAATFAEGSLWWVESPCEEDALLESGESRGDTAPVALNMPQGPAPDLTGMPQLLRERVYLRRRRNSMLEAACLLAKIKRLSASGRINEAIDAVIEEFENWLERGDWEACHHALSLADAGLPPAVTLSILSMTLVEKQQLKTSRTRLYQRVRQKLIDDYGPEEAEYNLRGLE